jgi:hypothetical protein
MVDLGSSTADPGLLCRQSDELQHLVRRDAQTKWVDILPDVGDSLQMKRAADSSSATRSAAPRPSQGTGGGALAEFERNLIRERTQADWLLRAPEGRWAAESAYWTPSRSSRRVPSTPSRNGSPRTSNSIDDICRSL